jgi:hypothetical protein
MLATGGIRRPFAAAHTASRAKKSDVILPLRLRRVDDVDLDIITYHL